MVLILQKIVGLVQLVIFTLSNTKEQKPSSGQFDCIHQLKAV